MSTPRRTRSRLRRALPWLGGVLATQGLLAAGGWLWAWRTDEGDDSTAGIRRTRALSGVALRPHHPQLSRVRLDLVMAGGEVDLTGVPRVPGGIDVTVRATMAGAELRVPRDWRVWVHATGPGGVDVDPALRRAHDDRFADLRVHARVFLAGMQVSAAEPAVGVPR